jgi:hypothetical protein
MAQVEHGRFRLKVATSGPFTFGFYAGNTLVKKLQRTVTTGTTTNVVFPISQMRAAPPTGPPRNQLFAPPSP